MLKAETLKGAEGSVPCHPECSEGSYQATWSERSEIPRCARDDRRLKCSRGRSRVAEGEEAVAEASAQCSVEGGGAEGNGTRQAEGRLCRDQDEGPGRHGWRWRSGGCRWGRVVHCGSNLSQGACDARRHGAAAVQKRRRDRGMAQSFLNGADRPSLFEAMDRETVTQRHGGHRLAHAGRTVGVTHGEFRHGWRWFPPAIGR